MSSGSHCHDQSLAGSIRKSAADRTLGNVQIQQSGSRHGDWAAGGSHCARGRQVRPLVRQYRRGILRGKPSGLVRNVEAAGGLNGRVMLRAILMSAAQVFARVGWVMWSVVFGFGICIATGLIPKWGQWYSANMAYRRQTEAFLKGALLWTTILERSAMTWLGRKAACSRSGVWACLAGGFPSNCTPSDRPRGLSGSPGTRGRYSASRVCIDQTGRATVETRKTSRRTATHIISAVPSVCRTNFDVYEEAQAYMYLAGIALFAATLAFVRRPTYSLCDLRPPLGTCSFRATYALLLRLCLDILGLGFHAATRWPRACFWMALGLFVAVAGCCFLPIICVLVLAWSLVIG